MRVSRSHNQSGDLDEEKKKDLIINITNRLMADYIVRH